MVDDHQWFNSISYVISDWLMMTINARAECLNFEAFAQVWSTRQNTILSNAISDDNINCVLRLIEIFLIEFDLFKKKWSFIDLISDHLNQKIWI